jgi:hypothetical protein
MTSVNRTFLATIAAGLMAAATPALAADIQLINLDAGTGLGLDDPSPRTPVGGNPGRTLGEQRLIAYQFAARLWGSVLEGNVPVKVTATFQPLTCTPTSGTLGSAGANQIFVLSGGSLPQATLFHVALAEALLGENINGDAPEINTRFNGAIGVNPNCLTGSDWYYGLDGRTPPNAINFLNVVMHEIAHGLGFSGFANVTTGALLAGFPDIYNLNAFSNTLGRVIGDTTLPNNQRAFAFRDDGNTVWTGVAVNFVAEDFLGPRQRLNISAPASIAGLRDIQPASFGPAATANNFTGLVAVANDGVGTGREACAPLVNASEVAGKIALVDRGTCTFTVKVANAQAAGAIGVIVANNAATGLPGMGGTDATIRNPSVGVTQADGLALRSNAGTAAVDGIRPDPVLRAGADNNGRVRLYVPAAVAPGSTFSHFDVTVDPNAVMEPFITDTLQSQIAVDMTPFQLEDVGWGINRASADFRGCSIEVPAVNDQGIIPGAHAVARMELCFESQPNKGQAQSCVVKAAQEMRAAGLISSQQLSRMTSCAATVGR